MAKESEIRKGRIEESYGDAKNLRGRHPLAATGFLFVLRSTAFDSQKDTALRLMDLIVKLANETGAYDREVEED